MGSVLQPSPFRLSLTALLVLAAGVQCLQAQTALSPGVTGAKPPIIAMATSSAPAPDVRLGNAAAKPAAKAAATPVVNTAAQAAAAARFPSVYAPTRPRVSQPRYPWKLNIVTTVFWIGETPTPGNATPNHASSWDTQWQINYGGFDDPNPESRAWDFRPKAFEPRLNPFYIALPFNDIVNKGIAAQVIPWFKVHPNRTKGSVCKSAWVAIQYGKKVCYAQWEDCGPFEYDDWSYVFGTAPQPKTSGNNGAGLDVSPAVRDYLTLPSGVRCHWRFCDPSEVPDGPWRKYGSNNPFVKSIDADLQERIRRMADLEKQREQWLKSQYRAGQ